MPKPTVDSPIMKQATLDHQADSPNLLPSLLHYYLLSGALQVFLCFLGSKFNTTNFQKKSDNIQNHYKVN